MQECQYPSIIQGGMGVAVSGWQLARAVSLAGQLGVVSGTAIDVVMIRRLQCGDPDGQMRHALAQFPFPEMAERIVKKYFIAGGKPHDAPFVPTPILPMRPTQEQLELVVAANFVEIFLAKEGHDGLVGVNYLEKIQVPTLPSLFGAMLADVDFVLVGAGIPQAIPGILDQLSNGEAVELPIRVTGADRGERFVTTFDPAEFASTDLPWINRPKFLAIVASSTLATRLARKSSGHVDGFIVEGPTAGGHNAPPRGKPTFSDRGEPIYGDRDVVDLQSMGALERPFWLAGSYGSPEQLLEALEAGAAGIQVGTAFAFCEESGINEEIKQSVFEMSRNGELDVFTDPAASPTGFPFKVLNLEGSLSDSDVYEQRNRTCDLGFLRECYKKPDGTVGWRCPGERIEAYIHKGGDRENTVGRKCVCNGLLANVGLEQVRREGEHEKPLLTCGNDVRNITRFLKTPESSSYTALEVIKHLLPFAEVQPLKANLASLD